MLGVRRSPFVALYSLSCVFTARLGHFNSLMFNESTCVSERATLDQIVEDTANKVRSLLHW